VALGGNSLLATQLVSRVRDVFGLDLPLKSCLNQDLEQLALRLEQIGAAQGVDVAQVAEVVLQVQAMSESEVKSLLAGGVANP
jgi:predicted transposase YdaD